MLTRRGSALRRSSHVGALEAKCRRGLCESDPDPRFARGRVRVMTSPWRGSRFRNRGSPRHKDCVSRCSTAGERPRSDGAGRRRGIDGGSLVRRTRPSGRRQRSWWCGQRELNIVWAGVDLRRRRPVFQPAGVNESGGGGESRLRPYFRLDLLEAPSAILAVEIAFDGSRLTPRLIVAPIQTVLLETNLLPAEKVFEDPLCRARF